MGMHNSYATDPELEKNGVVVTYPDIERGEPEAYRARLGRLSGRSSRYKKAQERVMKPYAKFDVNDLSPEVRQRTGLEIFIEAALLSFETKVHEGHVVHEKLGKPEPGTWVRGVELPPGEDGVLHLVPATPENLYAALSVNSTFLDIMFNDASAAELFRIKHRQDAAKNS